MFIQITPSWDCHMDCKPENFEISRVGLPFPRLDVFAQSLIDMNNQVDLNDLVDGMELTEAWGKQHLHLDGTVDVKWIERKNNAIRESVPLTETSFLLEIATAPCMKKDVWEIAVEGRTHRLGIKYPTEVFATRFHIRAEPDPREEYGLPPRPIGDIFN
jgi:hypothetical protein